MSFIKKSKEMRFLFTLYTNKIIIYGSKFFLLVLLSLEDFFFSHTIFYINFLYFFQNSYKIKNFCYKVEHLIFLFYFIFYKKRFFVLLNIQQKLLTK